MLIVLLLIQGCRDGGKLPDSETPEAEDTASTPDTDTGEERVAIDWGVAESCERRRRAGFSPFYNADGDFYLVYDEAETWLAERVYEWYSPYLPGLELRSDAELTDEERQENLFIVGSSAANALVGELNGSLPAWFDESGFTFGGYRYDEPGQGVALVHPNPWGSERYLSFYAGNTVWGAYSLFTIYTGGEDYHTTRGGWTLQQEGGFCRDDDAHWMFYAGYDTDGRAAWEAWVTGLESTETSHHLLLYEPDSVAADNMDWLQDWVEECYAQVLATLEVEALGGPIRTYLYPSPEEKGEITGNDGYAHANPLNLEVHEVYSDDVHAVGPHEDVHVVAWYRIGDADYSLLGEGLAVWVSGDWWGEPLEDWASYYDDSGEIPSLEALIDDFWSYDDMMTYPLAGHFIGFLVEGWGLDAVKEVYVAEDLDAAFEGVLGLTTAEVEERWLASIP